ncbi:hypothetical protein [Sorangium sp. So ce388]|uniref:hypothetical protein n=1 Tax=Sorangium sp. So ce388 TaxID=3133309 RepID=UPI003F5B9846
MVDLGGVAPLSPLTPILAACVALAWAITRGWWARVRWPFYRPVALLLSWTLATWLARGALQAWVLQPARRAIGEEAPYTGLVLVAYLAEVALRTSWPFVVLAASMAVFLRRRPWWVLPAWAVFAAVLCAAYPELRRGPQALVEAGATTACWLVSAWAMWRAYRVEDIDPVASHGGVTWVLAAQLSVAVVVQWFGSPYADWTIARIAQGGGYLGLLSYQAWKYRGMR